MNINRRVIHNGYTQIQDVLYTMVIHRSKDALYTKVIHRSKSSRLLIWQVVTELNPMDNGIVAEEDTMNNEGANATVKEVQ
jgi:hypothetical protein